MRSRLLPTLAASALLLGAASAQAGTLTSATWITDVMTFPGGLTVPFPVPISATGTSTATSVSVSLTVPGFSGSFFVPGPPLDHDVTLTLGGSQLLTATSSKAAATKGIPGNQITKVGANALVVVPLSVGVNGVFTTVAVFFPAVTHYITVDFYGWTPHTRTLTGLTTKLSPLPDVVAMGSFDLTANGGGTVTLVSPSRITVVSSLTFKQTASISTLKLTFVPEPGTLLLLGAAAVALAMRWRRYGNTR